MQNKINVQKLEHIEEMGLKEIKIISNIKYFIFLNSLINAVLVFMLTIQYFDNKVDTDMINKNNENLKASNIFLLKNNELLEENKGIVRNLDKIINASVKEIKKNNELLEKNQCIVLKLKSSQDEAEKTIKEMMDKVKVEGNQEFHLD